MPDILKFDQPKSQSNIIKVIGVGGGGSNAVNHMYNQGIKGVDFIICNTDAQAMESSTVPTKIQLGTHLTAGLGAGAVPSVGRNAALEDADKIREILQTQTKMVFITAGLGGGTGTGAAPVIAGIAKEMDILTVGIVTIPFAFEGRKRKLYADEGINQMKEHVDALLIISNDKLRELYGNLRLSEAFAQADDVLTTAAKGIAEIITVTGYINVDFEDVKTVMQNSGVAIMGTGVAEGENRALQAVEAAISSPLLNNNDIEGAGNLLLYIASGGEEITMDEVTEITEFIQEKTKSSAEVIWGNGRDNALGNKISVTIIATGFDQEHRRAEEAMKKQVVVRGLYEKEDQSVYTPEPDPVVEPMVEIPVGKIVQPLYEPEPELSMVEDSLPEAEPVEESIQELFFQEAEPFEQDAGITLPPLYAKVEEESVPAIDYDGDASSQRQIVFQLDIREEEPAPVIRPRSDDPGEGIRELNRMGNDRVQKLKALSERLKNHKPIEETLHELENVPAYKRRQVGLNDVQLSSESSISGMTVTDDPENGFEIRKENPFLHKNVD